MTFGLTALGFNPQRLSDILADFNAAWRTAFGDNVRVDSESVGGIIQGIVADRLADIWEQLQNIYASAYLDSASGAALDSLVKFAAITRNPATFSLVSLTLTGVNGTIIPAGSQIRNDDLPDIIWTTIGDATISSGTATVDASPTNTGPIVGLATRLSTIVTPVAGWTSVINAADATRGSDVQSDASLRGAYMLAMRAGGGSAADAIRAAILRLDSVTECIVLENTSDLMDADGMVPHSFECVVRGGVDQEIIDAIWAGKPLGIQAVSLTVDTVTGVALDSVGNGHTIVFSRPDEIPVYIGVDYTVLKNFEADGEAQILAAILDYGSALTIGADVIPIQIVQHIEVANILTMTIRAGLTADPPLSSPMGISLRQLAVLNSIRVTFNRGN